MKNGIDVCGSGHGYRRNIIMMIELGLDLTHGMILNILFVETPIRIIREHGSIVLG